MSKSKTESIYYEYTPQVTCTSDGKGRYIPNDSFDASQYPGYTNDMCNNKSLTDKLENLSVSYGGEDERYANVMSKYETEVLNSFNLGIGLMIGAFFLYKFQ